MIGTPARTHRGDDVPYNPALPNALQYVSSTQIKQFRECKRKWFFAAVRKLSPPSTAAMTLGQDVHSVLEEYAAQGPLFDWARKTREISIAREALPYLPTWANDWQSEVNLGDPEQGPQLTLNGVPFVSYIDLVVPPRAEADRVDLPLVVDYKTTKDLRYVKTESELRQDFQAVGYARWAAEKFWGAQWTDFSWLRARSVRVMFPYLLTTPKQKGALSKCTDFVFRLDQLVNPWAGFEKDVWEMLELATEAEKSGLDDAQVPPNWSSCGAWGGCPHQDRCNKMVNQSLDKQLVSLRASKDGEVMTTKRSLSEMLGDAHLVTHATAGSVIRNGDLLKVGESVNGFDLYIDAVPLTGVRNVILLESYLTPLLARIVQNWNDTKDTKINDVLEINFAAWKGPLRALLVENPPSGAVLARSIGETTQVALEVLRPMARSVWQGVR